MEQSFDSSPRVSVSKNTALSDDFVVNIQNCLADVTAKLGMLISGIATGRLFRFRIVDDLCSQSYFSHCFYELYWTNFCRFNSGSPIVVVCNTPRRRICNVTHQGQHAAAGQ